jgi:hypothetical protein
VSRVNSVSIEIRRRGTEAWTELATSPDGSDYVAFVDDESLEAGTYDLRARAVDLAGNERTTETRINGQPAVLELPVRSPATLRVGVASQRCTHGRHGRRCRSTLTTAPMIGFGKKTTLSGHLQVAGKAMRASVEVWRQLKTLGTPWERIDTLEASPKGRLRFEVPPGPASLYRFRYPGSPTARGATATVDARVRAATTFQPSRRNVVNGEYITFRGRLRGSHIPPGGKLVELQVFTRRRWRTFAQPRADAATGRWSFQYRFEAVRGRVRFRFRARIRREASYPFHVGTSRSVAVTVHGI